MTKKHELCLAVLLSILMLGIVFLSGSYASESQEVEFEIIEGGDISGYCEEAYFVVRTESEWEIIWEKHTIIREPPIPCPDINFSKNVVICAFMGKYPTAGYAISIERIWTDGGQAHVEIIKSSPPEDFAVAQVITCPYMFALLEKIDLQFVFHVAEKNGAVTDYVLTEFPTAIYAVLILVAFSVAIVALKSIKKLNP